MRYKKEVESKEGKGSDSRDEPLVRDNSNFLIREEVEFGEEERGKREGSRAGRSCLSKSWSSKKKMRRIRNSI